MLLLLSVVRFRMNYNILPQFIFFPDGAKAPDSTAYSITSVFYTYILYHIHHNRKDYDRLKMYEAI